MFRTLVALFVSIVLTGCTTVTIKVLPQDAQVTVGGKSIQTVNSFCSVRRPVLFDTQLQVSRDGYEPAKATITRKSPLDMAITLHRRFTINTVPEGALVTGDDGRSWGTTPCTVDVSADTPAIDVLISKDGYITRTKQLSAAATDTTISLTLLKNGPGRYKYDLVYGIAGFPVINKITVAIPDLEKIGDNATCLHAFNEGNFPFCFRSSPQDTALLMTLFCAQNNATANAPTTARLFSLETTDNTLTPVSEGTYFEHYGIQRDGKLFFLSRKTGRPDIWVAPQGTATDNAALHTTNRTIKQQLDYTSNGHKLLMTAFLPDEPSHRQIHILNADTPYAPAQHILCDGQNATWSPSGILVALEAGTPSRIFTITNNGAHLTNTNPSKENYCDKDPAWSPDGKSIVFSSNRQAPHPEDFDIWLYNFTNRTTRKIASSSAIDDMPQFSKDGSTVIFRSNRNNQWGLWQVKP